MGYTTNYQIPYPELTDIPDGAGQMKALAQQVDSKVKVIDNRLAADEAAVKDTGWIDLTSVSSFKTNWAAIGANPCRARRIGATVHLHLHATRVTTSLVVDASSNFADAPVVTLNDARFQPEYQMWGACVMDNWGGITVLIPAMPMTWQLQSATAPSVTVPIGGNIHQTYVYTASTTF